MFELRFENEDGDEITLTGVEDRYQVIHIEGLNPPSATVYRSEVAGMDGTKYMSAKLEERNVVVTVRINGDVEANRINLYRYFKTKHYCKMYYTNKTREVYAEGYVENIECDLFSLSEEMQISIVCPNPYFQAINEIVSDISKVIANFAFPFTIGSSGVLNPTITDDAIEFSTYKEDSMVVVTNEGEDGTGLIIRLTFSGPVTNPTIYNADTKEYFALKTTFEDGDEVTINTNSGEKRVTLLRDGQSINLINKVARDSVWLSLERGDTHFTYTADDGILSMQVLFTHRTRYQGV